MAALAHLVGEADLTEGRLLQRESDNHGLDFQRGAVGQQRLAPGAQIRDQHNRLVVPTAVPAGAQVRYLTNSEGMVRRVWILTPAEAAKREAVNK